MKHLKYFVDIILEKSIGSESIRLKYIATTKYPEISNSKWDKYQNYKPFDEVDDKEVWKIFIELEMQKTDRYDYLWKKLEMTLSLLSDKAKSTINEYWERNILNKQS